MMRAFCAVSMVALVAACQPAVPDSGRGVGFDSTAQAQRDAALAGPLVPSATNAPINGAPVQGSAAQTAAQTTAALDATRPASAPVDASPSNPAPVAVNAAGISRENNFDAVSGQRSIESDAARIASNRAQYEIVQPEALPTRRGSGGPNIVAYALQNQHPIGQQIYARGAFSGPVAGHSATARGWTRMAMDMPVAGTHAPSARQQPACRSL